MFQISLDLYQRDIIFFDNKEEFIKFAHDEEVFDEDLFEMTNLSEGRTVLTDKGYLMSFIKNTTNYGVVAHEIFHCIDIIFRQIWIELNDWSDEAYAYAIQYITDKFYNNINKT